MRGFLGKVATGIAELGGNITKAEVSTSADGRAEIKVNLLIRDMDQLEAIVKKISGIEEVVSVERP